MTRTTRNPLTGYTIRERLPVCRHVAISDVLGIAVCQWVCGTTEVYRRVEGGWEFVTQSGR